MQLHPTLLYLFHDTLSLRDLSRLIPPQEPESSDKKEAAAEYGTAGIHMQLATLFTHMRHFHW